MKCQDPLDTSVMECQDPLDTSSGMECQVMKCQDPLDTSVMDVRILWTLLL